MTRSSFAARTWSHKLYVVRHAHAGDRKKWTGPDELRPLSETGWRQAGALAGILEGVEQLLSSRYLRCRQTLEPLAEQLGLDVEIDKRLVEGTPFTDVLELIAETNANTAISTHGDIVEALVTHLQRFDLTSPIRSGTGKASTWALEVGAGRIRSARYIAPPR